MILYYAMGGGLGHLARARAFIHTVGILDEVAVLTASPFAADPRVVAGWRVVPVPTGLDIDLLAYRRWLQGTLEAVSPRAIYLDAFPAGILGELCDFPLPRGVPVFHLARLLRWDRYRRRLSGEPPRLDATYLLEPLGEEQEHFLRAQSSQVASLELRDLPHDPMDFFTVTLSPHPVTLSGAKGLQLRKGLRAGHEEMLRCAQHDRTGDSEKALRDSGVGQAGVARDLASDGEPLWLVVHSGTADETVQLISYAWEMAEIEGLAPRVALVAPSRPEGLPLGVVHLDLYPAYPLFPLAARIVTACGFNAMRQTEPYREKHRFIPFPRPLDDQFRRAARRRRGLQRPNLPGQ